MKNKIIWTVGFFYSCIPSINPFDHPLCGKDYVVFGTDLRIASAKQDSITKLKLEFEEKNSIVFRRGA